MIGWHHQFNGHQFKQAPGTGDGQGLWTLLLPWLLKLLFYNLRRLLQRTDNQGNVSLLGKDKPSIAEESND